MYSFDICSFNSLQLFQEKEKFIEPNSFDVKAHSLTIIK